MAKISYAEYERRCALLIGTLRGRVLEIGAGTGGNLGLLASEAEWIGLEPDPGRRQELDTAAASRGRPAALANPAEDTGLASGSVDAVLATKVLCSVADPAAVLAEVLRVLKPGGRAVFAEHVAAPEGSFKRGLQRAVSPFSARWDHGCRWDRDSAVLLAEAGFRGRMESLNVSQGILPSVPVILFDGTAAG
ncbi:class I SAM-dependent methyltransferase [Arthrobacter sp.]|uniref:class I SAM-dependent methyltransferase n=1 Tax=Arthrobacter sp. TaxID=1667 RepID=UPI00289F6FED|nr:class I SAM-dependent methyltransferase [Arthrobacter sp.]